MAIMLAEEDEHGLIEHMHIAKRGFLGGLTFIMDDVVGQIPVLPSTLYQAVGKVDILTIHEEVFIQ